MIISARTTTSMTITTRGVILVCSICGGLGSFFVFPVHRHVLTGEDMCESALVTELAVTLYEPGANLFCLTWFEDCMGEGARCTCCAGADPKKFAGNMGKVFGF